MRMRDFIGAGVAVSLAVALLEIGAPARAHSPGGWGMMGGCGYGMMGPWMMRGYGYGPGMMSGYGSGYGMMGGYGPGWMMGPRMMGAYGPGYGMMGSYGPGWMMRGYGGGYGPGWMMRGYGGYGPSMMGGYGPSRYGNQGNLNLSTDDVKNYLEQIIAAQGNPHLKVGDVKEKDADTIVADVVTKDNSLVQRFNFNRHTGFYQPEESQ